MTQQITTAAAALSYFVALTRDPAGQAAIFGVGTTEAEAVADAVQWGDPSDRPADEIWIALPATEALYRNVKDNGTPKKWGSLNVGATEFQCTIDEADAIEIADDILEAVGESVDGGSDLSGWNGEEAIDAYAEGSDWEDEVSERPGLRKAVASRIDAELADWRAEAA